MRRKLEMARWHSRELAALLPVAPTQDGLPPIHLQAHFEGAGRALAAIPDQLGSGIVEILGHVLPNLPPPWAAYLHRIKDGLPDHSDLQDALTEIVTDRRYCDLRSWRNRATHRFDRKELRSSRWVVEPPDDCEHWVEEREVGTYLETMTSFGTFIVSRLETLEALTVHLLGDPG